MEKPNDRDLDYFENVKIVWTKNKCTRYGLIVRVDKHGDPYILFDGNSESVRSQWEYLEVIS